jgi:hypothetical protein
VSKKKRRKVRRHNAERQYQALTLEMLEGWMAGEWGKASAKNFAHFCRWLIKQLKAISKHPK